MALHEEAKRMTTEFDYSTDEVNKSVKEFIRQMEEGLEKQGTTMAQIPTYVTAVPNGTEKVGGFMQFSHLRLLIPFFAGSIHRR
jgi:hexokinase